MAHFGNLKYCNQAFAAFTNNALSSTSNEQDVSEINRTPNYFPH